MKKNSKKTQIAYTNILGVRISRLSKAEAIAWIERWVSEGGQKMIVTPNPEQVMMAQKDGYFRQILYGADLALADGGGLVWAGRVLQSKVKSQKSTVLDERITGEKMMQELTRMAAKHGWKVFLLGGKPGVAEKAAEDLRFKIYDLRIRTSSGVKDIQHETEEERRRVIGEINRFRPDLLFVAYGAPWQEKWLARNLKYLDVKVGMVVGGALDMIVDPSLRPPKWMTNAGFDWLYRLLRQPWRIKRQMMLVSFVVAVLRRRFMA